MLLIPQSHYTRYILGLEVLLGGETTSQHASYLPGFDVSIKVQVV